MGVSAASGGPVSAALVAPALDLALKMLDDERPYRFGYDDQLLRQLIDMHLGRFDEMKDLRFPHHIIFINRTAAGRFGNLSRLRAAAPWRRTLEARLASSSRPSPPLQLFAYDPASPSDTVYSIIRA